MIEDLLEHIGIEDLQPRDIEIGGRCPKHEERTGEREHRPRHFSVNRSTGAFHCFSCAYGGSLIMLIMDLTKVGLWDAHQLLHRFDVELDVTPEERTWIPPHTQEDLETKLAEFGPPPERALKKRRLTAVAVEKFRVRWDYEESAWILPIYGPAGDLWGWQTKTNEYVRNRPPGVRKALTLFGIQVPRPDTIFPLVVESPLDAVYLDSLGYVALASFGAAVSDDQMQLLIERFDEVMLALDNDRVGINETRRLLDDNWHHRIPITVFNYWGTRSKDPGELTSEEIHKGITNSTLAGFW